MINPFEQIDKRLTNIECMLLDLKHPPLEDQDKLFPLEGLHNYLPENPAKQTIYGWVNNRKIPFEKHGSKLYFRKSDIDLWLSVARNMDKFEELKISEA